MKLPDDWDASRRALHHSMMFVASSVVLFIFAGVIGGAFLAYRNGMFN